MNRLQLRRRAKRGLVAGYIHEISGRHQHGAGTRAVSRDAAPRTPVAPAPQPEAAQLS